MDSRLRGNEMLGDAGGACGEATPHPAAKAATFPLRGSFGGRGGRRGDCVLYIVNGLCGPVDKAVMPVRHDSGCRRVDFLDKGVDRGCRP